MVGSERGFTMVEVLIAITLLGIGMMLFLQAGLISARFHRRSRAVSTSLLLAQQKMEHLRALGWEKSIHGLLHGPLPELVGPGPDCWQETVRLSGRRYRLVLQREKVAMEPNLIHVYCFWENGDGDFVPQCRLKLTASEREG